MKIIEVEIFDVKLTPTSSTKWNPVIVRIKTDEGIRGSNWTIRSCLDMTVRGFVNIFHIAF
jgi:hypothetical protein